MCILISLVANQMNILILLVLESLDNPNKKLEIIDIKDNSIKNKKHLELTWFKISPTSMGRIKTSLLMIFANYKS